MFIYLLIFLTSKKKKKIRANFRVQVVSDGKQALDILQNQTFDCILMDIQMAVMDGITATKEIRKRESSQKSKHTPIIALTANAMQGDMESYLGAGFG